MYDFGVLQCRLAWARARATFGYWQSGILYGWKIVSIPCATMGAATGDTLFATVCKLRLIWIEEYSEEAGLQIRFLRFAAFCDGRQRFDGLDT